MANVSVDEESRRIDFYEEASCVRSDRGVGGLLTFNIEFGYLEAILRGFRSGFINELQYRQLCQCETLEDAKMTLGDTDYGVVMQGKVTHTYNTMSSLLKYSVTLCHLIIRFISFRGFEIVESASNSRMLTD